MNYLLIVGAQVTPHETLSSAKAYAPRNEDYAIYSTETRKIIEFVAATSCREVTRAAHLEAVKWMKANKDDELTKAYAATKEATKLAQARMHARLGTPEEYRAACAKQKAACIAWAKTMDERRNQ